MGSCNPYSIAAGRKCRVSWPWDAVGQRGCASRSGAQSIAHLGSPEHSLPLCSEGIQQAQAQVPTSQQTEAEWVLEQVSYSTVRERRHTHLLPERRLGSQQWHRAALPPWNVQLLALSITRSCQRAKPSPAPQPRAGCAPAEPGHAQRDPRERLLPAGTVCAADMELDTLIRFKVGFLNKSALYCSGLMDQDTTDSFRIIT